MTSIDNPKIRNWKGFFWYGSGDEVFGLQSFVMSVKLNSGSFYGEVEEEIFSKLAGGERVAVQGFIEYDLISFVKRYPFRFSSKNGEPFIDRNQSGHEVTYEGFFNTESGKWQGSWELIIGSERIKGSTTYTQRVIIGFWEMSSTSESVYDGSTT